MSNFFRRKAELIIGNSKWTYPELEMKYKILFGTSKKPNISEIEVINLSESSIANITIDSNISFNAGYGSDTGGLLSGTVQTIDTTFSGVDRKTKIKCLNATNTYINSVVNKAYQPNKASFILNDLFASKGIDANKIELAEDKIYKSGFSAFGSFKNVVNRIAEECGSELIIRDTVIEIVKKDTGFTTGYLLKGETGLLKINKIDKKKSDAQYKIEMLLNHNIGAKSILEVDSKIFKGTCMVLRGMHQNFKTIVEVKTVG